MSINVFLPCRKGSVRIPNKNTKEFAGIKGGLLKIKLDQLLRLTSIESIIVSSNDDVVLDYVNTYKDSRVVVDERPDHLGTSETSTDELIKYVPEIIREGTDLTVVTYGSMCRVVLEAAKDLEELKAH